MIDNAFILVGKLGMGGSSQVYLAKDLEDNMYAVKVLRPYDSKKRKIMPEELRKEKQVMEMTYAHPNILTGYDFVEEGQLEVNNKIAKISYNVLEYGAKGSLASFIKTHKNMGEHIVRFFSAQLGSAVHFLHQLKIAHLDIKPQNILGDQYFNLKLADFGTCEIDLKGSGLSYQRRGTPRFMAPEVDDFSKTNPYNIYAADVYSLGATIYYMLGGSTPKYAKNSNEPTRDESHESAGNINEVLQSYEEEIDKELYALPISEELIDLLKAMLHFDPEGRPNMDSIGAHPWFGLEWLDVTPEDVYMRIINQNR